MKQVFFQYLCWTAVGGSFTGVIVEAVTLNSYFRQKHLQIKTSESSSEKILTVLLSWTILHYTDSLIGCKKKWQFKIKDFKWSSLPVSKLVLKKISKTQRRCIFSPLVSYFLFNVFCAESALSNVPFNDNFCKGVWRWREEIGFIIYHIHIDTHIEMPIFLKVYST